MMMMIKVMLEMKPDILHSNESTPVAKTSVIS